MSRMEMNIRNDERIVEIWLTTREKENEKLRDSLKPIYDRYKQMKYKVAVFQSGNRDLTDSTAGLLIHNRAL